MTQKQKVLKQMRETGSITRNWAIQNFITRLSAIMLDLKNDGVNFETKQYKKPNDYEYTLLDKPKIKNYFVNGILVATKTEYK